MEIEKLIDECSDDKNYKNLTLTKFWVEGCTRGGYMYGAKLEGHERQDGATLKEALIKLRDYLPRTYMILGIKDFPVNPNNLISDYTEVDNPYIFGSKEHARKFIGEAKNKYANDEMKPDEVDYLRVVELI